MAEYIVYQANRQWIYEKNCIFSVRADLLEKEDRVQIALYMLELRSFRSRKRKNVKSRSSPLFTPKAFTMQMWSLVHNSRDTVPLIVLRDRLFHVRGILIPFFGQMQINVITFYLAFLLEEFLYTVQPILTIQADKEEIHHILGQQYPALLTLRY